jgi:hypothetical protein
MKRQRTAVGFIARNASGRRPIDKRLPNVEKSVIGTAQVSTTLFTAGGACTITGLRWSGAARHANVGAFTKLKWAIVIVRDGQSASTLSTSDSANLYEPEQDVLAFGSLLGPDADAGQGPIVFDISGTSKAMRKLRDDDTIQFIMVSDTASSWALSASVQLFCME